MLRCVVFNASHEPLAVVSPERGLVLVLEGKAIITGEAPNRRFRSQRAEFPVPTSIVMKEYKKTGARYYGEAVKNQRNMFVRDEYRCQYCWRSYTQLRKGEYLTRDHVLPLSRGGLDEWTNIITACSKCNHLKDDRDLSDFAKYLSVQLEQETERLRRSTSVKDRAKIQGLVLRYLDMVQGIADIESDPPKAPTVFEIMLKRSENMRRVA